MRRPTAVVAAGLLTVLVAAGCASGPQPAPQSAGSIAAAQQAPTAPTVDGYAITIPTLAVSSSLVSLGLNPDRTIQVPAVNNPMQAGVYGRGPMPGEPGPAVVLAHVNGDGRQGFGAGFHTLRAGDTVEVSRPDGEVARFVVYETRTVPKGDFPTAEVYSDTAGPELRLVTCGGDLDRSAHNYLSNVIVKARQA